MKQMGKKQFLRDLHKAVKKLKCKPVLENHRLRFRLSDGDGSRYCPITLVCIHQHGIYYDPSYEVRKAARINKICAALREEINRATDLHPGGYNKNLRREMMRAVGRWQ